MWGLPDTATGGTIRRATRGTRRKGRKYGNVKRKNQAKALRKALRK